MAPKTSTSMTTIPASPWQRGQRERELRAEERAWAARSGPVRVIPAPPRDPGDRRAA